MRNELREAVDAALQEMARLRCENARLRIEIKKLRAEVAELKGDACHYCEAVGGRHEDDCAVLLDQVAAVLPVG